MKLSKGPPRHNFSSRSHESRKTLTLHTRSVWGGATQSKTKHDKFPDSEESSIPVVPNLCGLAAQMGVGRAEPGRTSGGPVCTCVHSSTRVSSWPAFTCMHTQLDLSCARMHVRASLQLTQVELHAHARWPAAHATQLRIGHGRVVDHSLRVGDPCSMPYLCLISVQILSYFHSAFFSQHEQIQFFF